MSTRDELASVLSATLNKQFKKDYPKVAYFLDGKEEAPSDISGWISTGSSMLDLAISNKPNGGIAIGRITEINGLESSGKSLVGAHILASTQKMGGIAVYMDTETAVSKEFLEVIGIDIDNMLYVHLETVEEIFEAIEKIVTKVREEDNSRLVTILVDSLAGASTKVEMEADFEKDGWATSKAIIMITQMIGKRKVALVFTNQLRVKLGVMFGDPWTTSGGKALPFHASTRIRLKNKGQIKDSKKNTIGMKIQAQVIKNRLGPPLRHCEFPLYFESGIDDDGSWLTVMKEHGIVKVTGAWYTLPIIDIKTGEITDEKKFQSKDWSKLLKDIEFRDYVYNLICDKVILKYSKEDLGIDDVEMTEEVLGD